MNSDRIDWVVFDLGGVLISATTALGVLAEKCGADPELFEGAYMAHRPDYDRTSNAGAYWRAVVDHVGSTVVFDDAAIDDLVDIDNNGWSVDDQGTVQLVDDLRIAQVKLAVLSNAPTSMIPIIKSKPWSSTFEHVVVSGDHHLVKPEAELFHLLLDQLGVPAERTVFLDDRQDNAEGARAVGMRAIQFKSADQARAELRELGLPV